MISVAEAKHLILQHCKALPPTSVPLLEAVGLTLASDIVASNDFPPFNQAAMDGYAFRFSSWNNEPLKIDGEVQAGASEHAEVDPPKATRIFTGAPLPATLDTMVMQEKVEVIDGRLHINDKTLAAGSNIRPQGVEIRKGDKAIETGTHLSASTIGFIAGLGNNKVTVYAKPVVTILVTGKELQKPGKPLQYGQVYESNGYALSAALAQCGITSVTVKHVDDDLDVLIGEVKTALNASDILLLTGGVSVGNYDFVAKAITACGVTTIFHKVKQRPGKPLLFGKKDEKIVFGLPGNPSSVLTCFYEYVLLALEKIMQRTKPFITSTKLPLLDDYTKNVQLTIFLKAMNTNEGVKLLGAQESFKMRSFAVANCLVVVEEESNGFKKGDLAEVHLLNHFTG